SQTSSRRAIVIARRHLDREGLGRSDRLLGSGQLDLELRRDEILDLELGLADRRRLRVEPQLDPPGADARIARQRETLMMRAQLVSRELTPLDFDPVGPKQPQA